jgi:hypothetical protein
VVVIGCSSCPSSTPSTIARSSFFSNTAISIVRVDRGAVDIRGSDFIDNVTDGNAAILVVGQEPVTVTNTTLIAHRGCCTGHEGVAIRGAPGSDVLVTNATIIRNSGGVRGVRIQNSIVAENDVPNGSLGDCVTDVTSFGDNLFGNPDGCGALASDLVGDPRYDVTGATFVACDGFGCLAPYLETSRPGGRYLRLLPDSPAIDSGDGAFCPAFDQQGLARPVDGTGLGNRACDIGAVEYYPVVNDGVELERLQFRFVRASNLDFTDPHASGGAYRITAVLRNIGPAICRVAFEVAVLEGPPGTDPVLLTATGELLGGQHAAVSAAQADAPPDLAAGRRMRYEFTVGVQERTRERPPIDFQFAVLGDATSGPCSP